MMRQARKNWEPTCKQQIWCKASNPLERASAEDRFERVLEGWIVVLTILKRCWASVFVVGN
jgi:hypothetical protein